jgi:hypothetical protein
MDDWKKRTPTRSPGPRIMELLVQAREYAPSQNQAWILSRDVCAEAIWAYGKQREIATAKEGVTLVEIGRRRPTCRTGLILIS